VPMSMRYSTSPAQGGEERLYKRTEVDCPVGVLRMDEDNKFSGEDNFSSF